MRSESEHRVPGADGKSGGLRGGSDEEARTVAGLPEALPISRQHLEIPLRITVRWPFVYVTSGKRAGQANTPWNRRAKIPLAGITASMIRSALRAPGARIETEIAGTGSDGGPACAAVNDGVEVNPGLFAAGKPGR